MNQSIRLYIIMNLAAWALFSLVDYIEETTNDDFEVVALIFLPVIVCVTYCIFELKTERLTRPFKEKAIDKLIWIGISSAFAVLVCYLLSNNIWIVKQAQGGWEHFLNGAEYVFLACCLIAICGAFFFIFDIGVWIYLRRKKN